MVNGALRAASSKAGTRLRASGAGIGRELRAFTLAAAVLFILLAYFGAGYTPFEALFGLCAQFSGPGRAPADLFAAQAPNPKILRLLLLVSLGIAAAWRALRVPAIRRLLLRRSRLDSAAAQALQFSRMTDLALLEQRDRSRREFLAAISHDLLKPVGCIRGYLETVLMHGDSLEPGKSEHYLRMAVKNTETLDRMVSECLELSKLECATTPPAMEPFPIQDVISDVYTRFAGKAAEARVSFEIIGDIQTAPVRGDMLMIERALSNLVDNALRYTPAGGKVKMSFFPHQGKVVVMVQDTGIGIAEEDLPRVIEPLYRAKKDGFRDPGGSGLGLTITHKIIQAHYSRLFVDSSPGKGTTIAFELLPAAPSLSLKAGEFKEPQRKWAWLALPKAIFAKY